MINPQKKVLERFEKKRIPVVEGAGAARCINYQQYFRASQAAQCTFANTQIQVHIQMFKYKCTNTYIHKNIYTNTYAQTHIDQYKYTNQVSAILKGFTGVAVYFALGPVPQH